MTMYPGEGMYVDDPTIPHPHHHHLPKMDDDDDDDDNDNDHHDCDPSHPHHNHQGGVGNGNSPYPPQHQHHNHPPNHPRNTPPPPHHPTPPPLKRSLGLAPLQPQQPLQPPTPLCPPQPLQPPTPLIPQPPLQPPIPLQPPPQSSQSPQPPPEKPRPPPPMDLNHPHHYNDADDDDDEKHKNPGQQQLGAAIFVVLLLFGLAALILWLIYRPSKPQFTAVAALVYSLNITGAGDFPPAVAASMQFVIHTRNSNKRTTLTYDRLAATVYYGNTAITPPVALPPLFHRKKSSVIIAPVVGGPPPAVAVPVGPDVVAGLAADEAYGVVGFSWVVVGRVRYRVGGFKSGHSRVFVRCDVVVRLIGGGGGTFNGGVYTNPSGQVPLLGTPPCFVDI